SNWLNSKKNLQCLITSTNDEFNSIVTSDLYKYTSEEVVLTGLPRYDSLLKYSNTSNTILIMPTWRNNLVGNIIGDGNERMLNPDFMDTDYAQNLYNLVHDPKLESLVVKFDYDIIFAPHANIAPYLDFFNVPNYIKVWDKTSSDLSIQNLFQKSKFMIT